MNRPTALVTAALVVTVIAGLAPRAHAQGAASRSAPSVRVEAPAAPTGGRRALSAGLPTAAASEGVDGIDALAPYASGALAGFGGLVGAVGGGVVGVGLGSVVGVAGMYALAHEPLATLGFLLLSPVVGGLAVAAAGAAVLAAAGAVWGSGVDGALASALGAALGVPVAGAIGLLLGGGGGATAGWFLGSNGTSPEGGLILGTLLGLGGAVAGAAVGAGLGGVIGGGVPAALVADVE